MSELTLREAIKREQSVRTARADVKLLDAKFRGTTSTRERARAYHRGERARRHLIGALLRRMLPPTAATDTFADAVDAALTEARFDIPVLDALAAALDTIKEEESGGDS